MMYKNQKAEMIVVRTAVEVDSQGRQAIEKLVQERRGDVKHIIYKVDPLVLGGIEIRMGDYLWDATIVHQLDSLVEHLKSDKS